METQTRTTAAQDAIAMLTADHTLVQKLFKDYDKLRKNEGDDEAKAGLCQQICDALTIHATVEEEIFYPAVRAKADIDDLMDEAEVEHAGAKDLIGQLENMEPDDPLYDAKVTVLGEYIAHHVKEEQDEMFPKAKAAKVDLKALGAEMAERKEELQREMGLEPDGEEDMPAVKPASRAKAKPADGARK